jgi:hypothetical protein
MGDIMATPMTLSQCVSQCKKWGINYEIYGDAIGRPGTFAPIGFVLHHTGGPFTESDSYLRFLFVTGRSDVPAQLCQFSGGPSGKIYIGKMARANHAGAGWWRTRELVGAENYNGYNDEIDPGADDYNTGNGLYYGLEVNYPGTVPMKDAQWNSSVKLAAAIMDFHGWTALSCIGHREHSYRKWDPGSHTLWRFRRDVRDLLIRGPGGSPPPVTDWFDMASEADLKRVIDTSINQLVPGIVDTRIKALVPGMIDVRLDATDGNVNAKTGAISTAQKTALDTMLDSVALVYNLTDRETKIIKETMLSLFSDTTRWDDMDEMWKDFHETWDETTTPKLDRIIELMEERV